MLEILPIEIEKIENEIKFLEIEFADAELFYKNPDRFKEITNTIAKLKKDLEDKFNKWEKIEKMQDNL